MKKYILNEAELLTLLYTQLLYLNNEEEGFIAWYNQERGTHCLHLMDIARDELKLFEEAWL